MSTKSFQLLVAVVLAMTAGVVQARAANLFIHTDYRIVEIIPPTFGAAGPQEKAVRGAPFNESVTETFTVVENGAESSATAFASQESSFNSNGTNFTLSMVGSTSVTTHQASLEHLVDFAAEAGSGNNFSFTLDAPAAFSFDITFWGGPTEGEPPYESAQGVDLGEVVNGTFTNPAWHFTDAEGLELSTSGTLEAGEYLLLIGSGARPLHFDAGGGYDVTFRVDAAPVDDVFGGSNPPEIGAIVPLPPAAWSMLMTSIGGVGLMWASARRRRSMRAGQ